MSEVMSDVKEIAVNERKADVTKIIIITVNMINILKPVSPSDFFAISAIEDPLSLIDA